jgi:hypothetical protein
MGRTKLPTGQKKMNLCIRVSPQDFMDLVEAETKSGLTTTKIVELCLQTDATLKSIAQRESDYTDNPF